MDYQKQAIDFLQKFNIEISINFESTRKYFIDDKIKRDVYNIVLTKENKKFEFNFGASIDSTEKRRIALNPSWSDYHEKNKHLKIPRKKLLEQATPTAYDVLACLQNYEVGDLDDFLSDFGYEIKKPGDLRKFQKIHLAVYEEWHKVSRFFSTQELNELREIQ
jgi:hypothetical protein